MAERATASVLSPAHRKLAQNRMVRRTTTASLGLAICLTGLFAGLASAAQPTGAALQPLATPDDANAQLANALVDYEKAVAARNVPAPAPHSSGAGKALAPPRAAPAPAAHPPTAVTGGS